MSTQKPSQESLSPVGDERAFVSAWGVSLILHGAVVALAFAVTTQVKPLLPEDVFKWDVALVEETKSESRSEQVQSIVPPKQPPAKAVVASKTKQESETYQVAQPIEQKVEQTSPPVESVRPIEQTVEPAPPREESIEQRLVETAESKDEPVAVAPSVESVEPLPAQPEPTTVATATPPEVSVPQEDSVQSSPQESRTDDAPVRAAKAEASSSAVKLDNRWLAESLWRRVAELKRYPNMARVNGQEGKVILKAVIRSDGQLAEVSIQKSSGYSVLDEAAMEAVKLACPLHMKQAIGKPLIVVSLPIVYSLAN